jgi:hypothetical protein
MIADRKSSELSASQKSPCRQFDLEHEFHDGVSTITLAKLKWRLQRRTKRCSRQDRDDGVSQSQVSPADVSPAVAEEI